MQDEKEFETQCYRFMADLELITSRYQDKIPFQQVSYFLISEGVINIIANCTDGDYAAHLINECIIKSLKEEDQFYD